MKKNAKHTRRLAVRAEILRELTDVDLTDVAGAAIEPSECQRNSCVKVATIKAP